MATTIELDRSTHQRAKRRGVRYYRTRGGGKNRKIQPWQLDELLVMYEEGVPTKEIMEHFDIATSTLYMYLRPYLEIRPD